MAVGAVAAVRAEAREPDGMEAPNENVISFRKSADVTLASGVSSCTVAGDMTPTGHLLSPATDNILYNYTLYL